MQLFGNYMGLSIPLLDLLGSENPGFFFGALLSEVPKINSFQVARIELINAIRTDQEGNIDRTYAPIDYENLFVSGSPQGILPVDPETSQAKKLKKKIVLN